MKPGKSFAAVLAALALPQFPTAAADFAPPPLFEVPLPTRSEPGPTRYPGDVAYLPDVTYKSVAGYRPLKLDLYLPKPGAAPAPVVIWIHGGGFEIGNPRADWIWGDWRPVLAELAARGYVVAAVTYRLSAEAPFPAQLEDVQDAVRFLRENAAKWNGDPSKVIAWGLSAGGGLSALAGTACADGIAVDAQSAGRTSACIQGAVDWFGPTSFEGRVASSGTIQRFLGCTASVCPEAKLREASVLYHVRSGLPPFLIMQGAADPLVTPDQSTRLADALTKAGVKNEIVIYPGLGHGFSGASPEKLREILLKTFDGIDVLAGKKQPAP